MDGYINREEFIQELILRERVRELVGEVQLEENKKNIKNNLARHRDIKKLRSLVAKIIVEAEEMASDRDWETSSLTRSLRINS